MMNHSHAKELSISTSNGEFEDVVVVIPYYNGSKFIERAINSVFSQTVQPKEVLVVDDGSSSEENQFLVRLAETYPFKIITKKNGGQGDARNAGVEASVAKFICFLDQDDFYLPNHIEDLVSALPTADKRFGFLYGDLCMADGDGNFILAKMVKSHAAHPKTSIIDMISADMFVLPSASIISRVAFAAVGGFDKQFMGYEDDDLFLRIFRAGYSNYYIDKSVTVWCIHPESTSYSIRMLRSRFKYFKKLTATFPDDPSRGLYFFRDCIVPRFNSAFIKESIVATKENSIYLKEINEMLKEYTEIVVSSPYIDKIKKWSLILLTHSLVNLPRSLLKFFIIVSKLPVLRRIPRFLLRA